MKNNQTIHNNKTNIYGSKAVTKQKGMIYNYPSVNIREEPTMFSKIVCTCNEGTYVDIVDDTNKDFYKVEIEGLKSKKIFGYVSKNYCIKM